MRVLALALLPPVLAGCVMVVPVPLPIPTAPAPAQAIDQPAPCARPAVQRHSPETVLAVLNAERRRAGLPAVQRDPRLDRAAQRQACDNAASRAISHVGADGSDLGTRLRREGFTFTQAYENTALVRSDGPGPVALWQGSSGHRANNLRPGATLVGIGHAGADTGRESWILVLAAGR